VVCAHRSAIEDRNLGLGRNPHECGLGLNQNTLAEKRGELTGRFGDSNNGAGISDTENAARLPLIADEVASTETEDFSGHNVKEKRGAAVKPRPCESRGNLIGRMKRLILGARVGRLTLEDSARVLPNLAAAIPVKAKL
jgi:hypothetical protein